MSREQWLSSVKVTLVEMNEESWMNTRYLLRPGAMKILDSEGELLGFSYVESTSDGQIQRWLFRRKPESFSIVDAELDISLPEWMAMVSTPAPDAQQWGVQPKMGLWLPNSIYIVAKSIVYCYGESGPRSFPELPSILPEPSFASEPSQGSTYRQLDLGSHEIFQTLKNEQSENIVGHSFAFGGLAKPSTSDTWASSEYWVLFGDYQQAGEPGLVTHVRRGRLSSDADEAECLALVKGDWGSGCTLEVTGCNNYQGVTPPQAGAL